MVTGFMVPLSIRWSLLTSHLRGIKGGIIVASREPKKAPLLEVRTMYEPSRIAPVCLVQAYERVVPLTGRFIINLADTVTKEALVSLSSTSRQNQLIRRCANDVDVVLRQNLIPTPNASH